MSTTETVQAWSTTAASNNTADAAITSADTQSPDTIDNNIRSVMAAVAKYRKDTDGGLAAGGTANALTVTTNQVLESGQIAAGLRLLLRATADNTSTTVTFAPDGLTAANIKRADGSALAVGSIKSGMYLDLVYNSGSSEWRCANIAPVSGSGGSVAFSAHKNGSDQSVATVAATKVTFGTEVFDVGSTFATSTWTPPVGTVMITVQLTLSSITANNAVVHIYKNGAAYKTSAAVESSLVGGDVGGMSIIDNANGTDTYEVYVDSASDAAYSVYGGSDYTWFMGSML